MRERGMEGKKVIEEKMDFFFSSLHNTILNPISRPLVGRCMHMSCLTLWQNLE